MGLMSKFDPILAFLLNSQRLPHFNQEINLYFPLFSFFISALLLFSKFRHLDL